MELTGNVVARCNFRWRSVKQLELRGIDRRSVTSGLLDSWCELELLSSPVCVKVLQETAPQMELVSHSVFVLNFN